MDVQEFAGQVAVVTGAAGGIGQVVARRAAELGATVACLDHDAAALEVTVRDLVRTGLAAVAIACDVTDARQVEAAVDTVESTVGPVELLVNVAGVLRAGPLLGCSDRDWEQTFAVNTTGVFHCLRAAGRRMAARRRGAIVTVTSNSARVPRMNMAAYGASKAASGYLTRALGLELAALGIRCNVVNPGSTDSPMLRVLWSAGGGSSTGTLDGEPAAYRVGVPLRKLATPDDIADAVCFLLSDRADHITMQELTVDGGAALSA